MVQEPFIKFIGQVHSTLKQLEDCPLQENENAPEAMIHIFPSFIGGLKGLYPGETILLLTWLDRADRSMLECKPRNDPSAAVMGVFATRSPDRPNPIGIHKVKIISLGADGYIKVSGLEVLDQTPLLDIKPIWNLEKQR